VGAEYNTVPKIYLIILYIIFIYDMESTITIFITHVIFHFLFLNGIETYDPFNVRYSLGKLYLSVIAGLSVILIMMLHRHGGKSKKYTILTCIVAIAVVTYLYRSQTFINDKQYIIEMLDQYDTSSLINDIIILKTDNELVKAFTAKIKRNRASELTDMNILLNVL